MNVNRIVKNFFLPLFLCATCLAEEPPKSMPEAQIITTKPGSRFQYLESKDSELIEVCIAFKYVGSAYQPVEKMSVPGLCAETFLDGAGKYSKEQLEKICNDLSMSITTRITANHFYIMAVIPVVNKKQGLEILLTVLSSPNFEEKSFKRKQQILVASIHDYNSSPFMTAFTTLIPEYIFKDTSYGRGVYGKEETLLKVSINDVKEFYKNNFSKSNVEVGIYGDISQTAASEFSDEIYKLLSTNEISDQLEDIEPKLTGKTIKCHADTSQSTVLFAMKNVSLHSEQYYAAALLYRILGERSCFKSRLLSKLRTKNGLVYSAGIQTIPFLHSFYALGYMFVAKDRVEESISIVKDILQDVTKRGVTQEELNFAKNNYVGSLAVDFRSNIHLYQGLFAMQVYGFPTTRLNDELVGIQKVTLKEVNTLAKTLFQDVTFIVIGDQK